METGEERGMDASIAQLRKDAAAQHRRASFAVDPRTASPQRPPTRSPLCIFASSSLPDLAAHVPTARQTVPKRAKRCQSAPPHQKLQNEAKPPLRLLPFLGI